MEELQQELADVKQENDTLKNGIVLHQSRLGRILELENENQLLKQQFQQLLKKLADVEEENDALADGLKERQGYVLELERVNWLLRQETADASVQPDYEVTRDRTLAKLKMGRQSSAGKAIDAFVKELALLSNGSL